MAFAKKLPPKTRPAGALPHFNFEKLQLLLITQSATRPAGAGGQFHCSAEVRIKIKMDLPAGQGADAKGRRLRRKAPVAAP